MGPHRYAAFVSYSHASDGWFAPALKRAIERYGRPWYRPKQVTVFLDNRSLPLNPDLWESVAGSLDDSEYLLLLASPESADSRWVEREVAHFLATRTTDRILLAITGGWLTWDASSGYRDPVATTCLPALLRERLTTEPRWVDFRRRRRWFPLHFRRSFRHQIGDLAATLHGRDRDEIIAADTRRRRRGVTLAAAAVAAVLLASGLAVYQSGAAASGRRSAATSSAQANRQRRLAVARQLDARAGQLTTSDPLTAMLLGGAAYQVNPNPETRANLANVLLSTGPTSGVYHGAEGRLTLLALADGDRTLIAAGQPGTRELYRWTTSGRRPRPTLTLPDPGPSRYGDILALSSDGHLIAWGVGAPPATAEVGPQLDHVDVFDLSGDQLVRVATVTSAELGEPIHTARFDPGANWLAVAGNNTAGLFPMAGSDPPKLLRLSNHADQTYDEPDMALPPDGRHLATLTGGLLVIWDITATPRKLWSEGTYFVGGLTFSPDGRTLAVFAEGGILPILLINVSDMAKPVIGDELDTPGVSDGVLAFSPSGNELAASSDGDIFRWSIRPGAHGRLISTRLTGVAGPSAMTYGSQGHTILEAYWSGSVAETAIRDPSRPVSLARTYGLAGQRDISPDWSTMVTPVAGDRTQVWDLTSPARPRAVGQPVAGLPVAALDGHRALTGDPEHRLTYWDLASPDRPIQIGTTIRADTAWTLGGGFLLTSLGQHDDADTVWNVNDWRHPHPVPELTHHLIAVGGLVEEVNLDDVSGPVYLWDMTSGQPRRSTPLRGGISAVSPDRKLAIIVDGETRTTESVRLLDIADIAHPVDVTELEPAGDVCSVAISPDSRTVAAANCRGILRLWDVTDVRHPRVTVSTIPARENHVENVPRVLAFSSSHLLAVAYDPGPLAYWDVSDPARPIELATPLIAVADPNQSVVFAPSGNYLFTDGLWDISGINAVYSDPLRAFCDRVGTSLGPAEWADEVPDGIPYPGDACRK